MGEPKYLQRQITGVVDPYGDQLRNWLEIDSHRPKRDRRTARIMFEAIKAHGSYMHLGRKIVARRDCRIVCLGIALYFLLVIKKTDHIGLWFIYCSLRLRIICVM